MLQFKWLIFHGHHRFEHIPSLNLLVIFGANFLQAIGSSCHMTDNVKAPKAKFQIKTNTAK